MIRIVKIMGKVIIAGIMAVAIISFLLCFYSITPVHVENSNGNTDYVWQPKSIWVKMTEGISFGRYDEKGYNNKTVIENPDIIVVGSSHMEATNVMQDENASYLLSEKLDDKYSIYNMGISGHNFPKICQYLPRNMELFDIVPKVTIMETGSVRINSQNVDEIINSSVEHTQSHSSGIIGMLQKIPFCRLIYQQIDGGLIDLFMPPREAGSNLNEAMVEDVPSESKVSESIDYAAYDELFSYLEKIESEYGTQIVIFYHPFETIQSDGAINYDEDSTYLKTFNEQAQNHNISFVDMTSSFENMYYSEHHTAHGFPTGKIGSGHLNKYGHAAVAEELYDVILELEGNGLLCK